MFSIIYYFWNVFPHIRCWSFSVNFSLLFFLLYNHHFKPKSKHTATTKNKSLQVAWKGRKLCRTTDHWYWIQIRERWWGGRHLGTVKPRLRNWIASTSLLPPLFGKENRSNLKSSRQMILHKDKITFWLTNAVQITEKRQCNVLLENMRR